MPLTLKPQAAQQQQRCLAPLHRPRSLAAEDLPRAAEEALPCSSKCVVGNSMAPSPGPAGGCGAACSSVYITVYYWIAQGAAAAASVARMSAACQPRLTPLASRSNS